MSKAERRARRREKRMMKTLMIILVVAVLLFGYSLVQLVETARYCNYVDQELASFDYLLDENEKEL